MKFLFVKVEKYQSGVAESVSPHIMLNKNLVR
jgi:hypothetical protein